MDKKLILAVAGSGKTTYILNKLDLQKKSLIITYTTNNIENIRLGIIRKFGYFPNNIKLFSYFTFLNSFCYKPFLAQEFPSKGIYWDQPPEFTSKLNRENKKYYLHQSQRLYHNRLAKLLEIKNIINDIKQRIEKYYDSIYIDEIQDFGGQDFNFLKNISKCHLDMTFVGDFFQHTFDTSRDGSLNKSLHNDYGDYLCTRQFF